MPEGHGFKENKDIYNFPEDMVSELGKVMFPVGYIYMSTSNVNPGTIFNGTEWIAWGGGRVPVGCTATNDSYNNPDITGGSETGVTNITLSSANMPRHSHTANYNHQHGVPGLNRGTASNVFLQTMTDGRAVMMNDPDNVGPASGNISEDNKSYFSTKTFPEHTPELDPYAPCVTMSLGRIHDPNSIVMTDNENVQITMTEAGETKPFNVDIRQAYITCYMWKRIK